MMYFLAGWMAMLLTANAATVLGHPLHATWANVVFDGLACALFLCVARWTDTRRAASGETRPQDGGR